MNKLATISASDKRIRTAAKVMGCADGYIGSTDRFICDALRWLGHECGDVHLQMTKGDGWQVATCFDKDAWDGWLCGKSMQDALAKAVVAVGKKRGDL